MEVAQRQREKKKKEEEKGQTPQIESKGVKKKKAYSTNFSDKTKSCRGGAHTVNKEVQKTGYSLKENLHAFLGFSFPFSFSECKCSKWIWGKALVLI